jgi:hypothetical protein
MLGTTIEEVKDSKEAFKLAKQEIAKLEEKVKNIRICIAALNAFITGSENDEGRRATEHC